MKQFLLFFLCAVFLFECGKLLFHLFQLRFLTILVLMSELAHLILLLLY